MGKIIKKIKIKGEIIEAEICDSIFSRARGLMFRKQSKPLLFVFKKPVKQSVHSFFCKPFAAIWFNGNEIVDVKVVQPWKLLIKPLKRFDKLLEVPSSNENFKKFTDGRKF